MSSLRCSSFSAQLSLCDADGSELLVTATHSNACRQTSRRNAKLGVAKFFFCLFFCLSSHRRATNVPPPPSTIPPLNFSYFSFKTSGLFETEVKLQAQSALECQTEEIIIVLRSFQKPANVACWAQTVGVERLVRALYYLARRFGLRLGLRGRARRIGGRVLNNLQRDSRADCLPSRLWEYILFFSSLFFFCSPHRCAREPTRHVSARILCRLFQMRTSSLSEDFACCACRVARPQPRGFSVRQQGDGQHNSATRREGHPQVSPCAVCVSLFFFFARFVLPRIPVLFHST